MSVVNRSYIIKRHCGIPNIESVVGNIVSIDCKICDVCNCASESDDVGFGTTSSGDGVVASIDIDGCFGVVEPDCSLGGIATESDGEILKDRHIDCVGGCINGFNGIIDAISSISLSCGIVLHCFSSADLH